MTRYAKESQKHRKNETQRSGQAEYSPDNYAKTMVTNQSKLC